MLSTILEAMGLNKQKTHLRRWREAAGRIGAIEQELLLLSDEDLKARAARLKVKCTKEKAVKLGKKDLLLDESFALTREASRRLLGMRHFDVQIIGGMALHEGKLAEMRTGEGKSLCLTLAAIYNALCGAQTHVVTVNEYLARRDAQSMQPLYNFFDLEVGLLEEGQHLPERRVQYSKDIIYGVNHDFGFDYLRHNMARNEEERRMLKGLSFAIVDEVDSILIDEARTPLVISGTENDDLSVYQHCWRAACALEKEKDIEVDEKQRNVIISERGFEKLENLFMEWNIIESGHHLYEAQSNAILRALQACLSARFLFHKDQHYIVREGKVLIVDENTGRLMADRRWSNGIHQAVEEKEVVEVLQESKTMATITYQNFFGLYGKLAGLTGTAMTQAEEFWSIYGLEAVAIPTHRPMIRIDQADVVYRREGEKFKALAEEAKKAVEDGRPVLAGTSNIEESEKLSRELSIMGIEHKLLNAKNHELEAQIIEQAGFSGRVTVATNMAGRGTDIVLGGNWSGMERDLLMSQATEAEIEAAKVKWEIEREKIIKAGGLLLLGCARNESRRVDNQLRGRSGRQGDPGESKFFISLDDNLFRIYAQNGMLAMIDKYNMMPEGSCLEHPMLNRSLDKAQAAVENHHFDMRKQLMDYDGVGANQRKTVYAWRDEIIDCDDASAWSMAGAMIEHALDQVCKDMVAGEFIETWSSKVVKETLESIGPLPVEFDAWVDEADDPNQVKTKVLAHWLWIIDHVKMMGWATGAVVKSMILERIDDSWQEHLTILQNLMDGIHLRSYAQKDPKQEYKREGYEMFARLKGSIIVQSACSLLLWAWSAKNYAEQVTFDGNVQAELSSDDEKYTDKNEEQTEHWLDLVKRDQEQFWRDFLIEGSDGLWTGIEFKTIQGSVENGDSACVKDEKNVVRF